MAFEEEAQTEESKVSPPDGFSRLRTFTKRFMPVSLALPKPPVASTKGILRRLGSMFSKPSEQTELGFESKPDVRVAPLVASMQDSEDANNISTTVNTQAVVLPSSPLPQAMSAKAREMLQEEASSANVFLNYFKLSQDEATLDLWFRTLLPMIQASELDSKRLKTQITCGIPVSLRGNAWQGLVGNKLRINT